MRKTKMKKHRLGVVSQASGLVLEIGFGSGLNLPYYNNITKLYALDPSIELFEFAKRKIRNSSFSVEYITASAEKIPLTDNSFDSVVSTWTLCSIPTPKVALKEIFRVLKSNGKFTFIEHGKSPKNLTAKIQKLLTPIWRHIAGGCHLDREIEKLIIEAGFEIEKIEKFQENLYTYKGIAVAKK